MSPWAGIVSPRTRIVSRNVSLSDRLFASPLSDMCKPLRYRGVSFLHFRLSQARDVETFCERPHQKRPSPLIELYPEGFSHPYLVHHKKFAQRTSPSQGEKQTETLWSEGPWRGGVLISY